MMQNIPYDQQKAWLDDHQQKDPLTAPIDTEASKRAVQKTISNILLSLTDAEAETEYEREQLAIKKTIFMIIRVFRLIAVAVSTLYVRIYTNHVQEKSNYFYIYIAVIFIQLLYSLMVFFRWEKIKRYISLLETIFLMADNIMFNQIVAQLFLQQITEDQKFTIFSSGQQIVLISTTVILAIDNYILKGASMLSIISYITNQEIVFVNIVFMIVIVLVTIIVSWMLQKETKLFFYENYVQKKSVKNFKDYFHKTLSQPIIVVKLKESFNCNKNDNRTTKINLDVSNSSILDVLYCNQNASEQLHDQGKYLLDNMPVIVHDQKTSLGAMIAQKIQQSQANSQTNSFNSYDFLQIGEEQFIPATEVLVQKSNDSKEKQKKFYSVKWNTCIWEGQYGCILQISDITLQHENAEKIQWQKINEYKDELLATVSHDLKTPLNSILISVQAMSRDSLANEFEEHRQMALNNAQYLEHLISDIMDYSMISKGKLRVVPVKFNVENLLTSIKRLFTEQCQQKNIDLIIENEILAIEGQQQQTIFTKALQPKQLIINNDQKRITQILINLVSNALKFTEKGAITVRVWQELSMDNAIQISVRDSGCGIPYDLQPKLFKTFSTFDHNRGQNKHGVGLGLCITQNLARLVGPRERIQMESVPGEGSCFSFSVYKNIDDLQKANQIACSASGQTEETKKHQNSNQNLSSVNLMQVASENAQICLSSHELTMNLIGLKKPELRRFAKILGSQDKQILIVDDYPYNIRALQILFQGSRFIVEGATSADAGLTLMKEKKYDLAFFDVNMPIKDGIWLTREVRELILQNKIADICIVQCTAYDTEQDKTSCLDAGADGFLSKPITYEKLINSVQQAMQNFRKRLVK